MRRCVCRLQRASSRIEHLIHEMRCDSSRCLSCGEYADTFFLEMYPVVSLQISGTRTLCSCCSSQAKRSSYRAIAVCIMRSALGMPKIVQTESGSKFSMSMYHSSDLLSPDNESNARAVIEFAAAA